MTKELTIKKLEILLGELVENRESEKLRTFTTIAFLITRLLDVFGDDVPNLQEHLSRLLWNCETIAGLDQGNGHDIDLHLSWARTALNNLKSVHCLAITD